MQSSKRCAGREGEYTLFALSDVIDETNINSAALIRHLMSMYEGIVGP